MKLKIPPPVLFLLCIAIIKLLPTTELLNFTFLVLASVLFFVGLVIAVASLLTFWQAKTTVSPKKIEQASTLITTGVFRLSRNPMYLSLALWLLTWTIFCETLWGMLVVIGFIAYLTEFQIKPEEKFLVQKFGKQYLNYKQSVRRWI
ncbi:isoprenylcysteine carboxylmethyltransferase family protein [Actinobacillus porcinus]|uniref:methyltransferase family protein n=1 Tax=Actinobacillus porcinus TaxID=51048 RepID=UPI002A910088|nr:isoprenylcysteine carboxylmethyltransferase family protein [Actinobacillus porcinus]MDY6215759.1 isoprenylcysteine carboxylmethyltransferase family protein [Actinobacillus porcinus]